MIRMYICTECIYVQNAFFFAVVVNHLMRFQHETIYEKLKKKGLYNLSEVKNLKKAFVLARIDRRAIRSFDQEKEDAEGK